MAAEEIITVSFCCNDERGNCAGRVRAVHVDDDGETIEMESPWASENDYDRVFPSIHFEARHVRVGHLRLLMTADRAWHGNIFWHGVQLFRDDAKRLVRYLVETRDFQIVAYPLDSTLLPAAPTLEGNHTNGNR